MVLPKEESRRLRVEFKSIPQELSLSALLSKITIINIGGLDLPEAELITANGYCKLTAAQVDFPRSPSKTIVIENDETDLRT